MAIEDLHNCIDDWVTTLDGAINDSVTTMSVATGGMTGGPSVPFYLDIDDEIIEVTVVSGDDLTTIVRGALGSVAAAHSDGARVAQHAYAGQMTEIHTMLRNAIACVASMSGNKEGVIRTAVPSTDLQVVAAGTPDMTVEIKIGGAFVGAAFPFQATFVHTQTATAAMTAPTGNPRIDIVQIARDGTLTVKTGAEAASPSAPTVDTNNLKLCEIYHRVGETSIKDTDDSTNGYITDSRVFK